MTDSEGEPFAFIYHRGKLCLDWGDTLYEVTKALRDGARSAQGLIPYPCNPHREGSRAHEEWSDGHVMGGDRILGPLVAMDTRTLKGAIKIKKEKR